VNDVDRLARPASLRPPPEVAPVRPIPSLPLGTVLALVGGLSLLAAYTMPWLAVRIGNQGILLSGDSLTQQLSNVTDLRQLLPGSSGNPLEAQALRALILLVPVSGGVAAVLALLEGWLGRRRWLSGLLIVSGLLPLVGLLGGLNVLPPMASREHGLWLMGLGSAAVILGPLLNDWLASRRATSRPAGQ
jgi:hypothetical protein